MDTIKNNENINIQFITLFSNAINEVFSKNERNILIVQLRYGLVDGRTWTLQEIGERVGLTRERIRQITNKAIRRIKYQASKQQINRVGECYYFLQYIQGKILIENELDLLKITNFVLDIGLPLRVTKQLVVDLLFTSNKDQVLLVLSKLIDNINVRSHELNQIVNKGTRANESINSQIIWPNTPLQLEIEKVIKLTPVREVNFDNYSNTGRFYSRKLNREVMYESGLELSFIHRLEKADQVQFYVEQPFKIKFNNPSGEVFNYTPDFFFILNDNTGVIVEIKPKPHMGIFFNIQKWLALHNYCKTKGLGYIITNGTKCIQQIGSFETNKSYEQQVLDCLEQGKLTWRTYSKIKDEYKVNTYDFISLIIRNNLGWILSPFKLFHTNQSFPIEWKEWSVDKELVNEFTTSEIQVKNTFEKRKNIKFKYEPSNSNNQGSPWSRNEETQLINLYSRGLSISEIATIHGRTYGAIRKRLKNLGLIK